MSCDVLFQCQTHLRQSRSEIAHGRPLAPVCTWAAGACPAAMATSAPGRTVPATPSATIAGMMIARPMRMVSSTANAQVSGSADDPGGTFTSPGVLSLSGYFMHACNRNLFFFQNCKLCDNCRCLCTGKIRFSVYGKIRVSMHCKVLCNLQGRPAGTRDTSLSTTRCFDGKHCVR